MKKLFILICLPVCLACSALSQEEPPSFDLQVGLASLDTVWQTVNEFHYDTTFGGIDWKAVHDRYYKLAAEVDSDSALLRLMNEMLLELKVSHYAVFRKESKGGSGSPLFSEASAGLDLRLLGGEAVITSLTPGFPAEEEGLMIGYVVTRVNGVPVKKMLDEAAARQVAHFNERRKINSMCDEIVYCFFGHEGDTVSISYRDGSGNENEVTLRMKKRGEGTTVAENFPTVFVDFNSRMLSDDIGYVYFSAVLPPADSLFFDAMEKLSGMRGLVIDIRGNPGGMHVVGEGIASKFVHETTRFSVFRDRDSTSYAYVEPSPPIFDGPIVILIDVMNGSASERFSGCMQSIGRAVVIGERSPGSVGPSDMKRLPNGAALMYLIAQSLTPDGVVLEGHGVIPDIEVSLDRSALLGGTDAQLERAISYLQEQL